MSPAGRRGVLIGGALLVVAFVVAAIVVLNSGGQSGVADAGQTSAPPPGATDPASAIQEYLQDFAEGSTDQAAALTDDPKTASAALRDARNTLAPVSVTAKLGKLDPTPAGGAKTQGTFTVGWTLRQNQIWTYDSPFSVVRSGQQWLVHWAPTLLHPKLEAGQRLALVTGAPDTPVVVDAAGRPLELSSPTGARAADPAVAPLLQSALASQAAGTKGSSFTIQRVDTSGQSVETLFGQADAGVKPAVSSVNIDVQKAAQSTMDGFKGSAMMVVIQPSTGDIQAVAQNSAAGTAPLALSGQYAPGSTFKIATATAALEAGLATPDAPLACPLTEQIGTRTLKNEGFDLGTVPMHKAFAHSCNTTFGKLASQLPPDGLAKGADQLGLNADFSIPGLTTEAGKVTPASGDAQVECGIGQGPAVEVSPFGEALMAATVAAGKAVTPRFWHDQKTDVTTGYTAPPAAVLGQVRGMMREVVTSGTATKGFAGSSSGNVFGKTGTAQFGNGDKANGWFVGYRGDVAFAILLEGSNDSNPAVSLAAKFLAAL